MAIWLDSIYLLGSTLTRRWLRVDFDSALTRRSLVPYGAVRCGVVSMGEVQALTPFCFPKTRTLVAHTRHTRPCIRTHGHAYASIMNMSCISIINIYIYIYIYICNL